MSKIRKINYQIETENLNKRIILLSDIHYYNEREKKQLDRVLEELKKVKYDYLCIAGDLLDISIVQDDQPLIDWLEALGKMSKVIISIGNHDLTSDRKKFDYNFNEEFFKKIKKLKNIIVLDNEVFVAYNIRIIGLTLPVDYYYQYKENKNYFMRYVNNIFPKPFDDKYNILLCHTPVPFVDKAIVSKTRFLNNIELVLCGHMHGGVTPKCFRRILRGRGLVGPFMDMFPKHSYGIVANGKNKVIISSGITTAAHSNLFSFVDSMFMKEITVIDLVKKK